MPEFPSAEWANEVVRAANDDPQFARLARHAHATVLFEFGDQSVAFALDDGTVESREPSDFAGWDVALRAPMETWEKYLSESPEPFYNDLRSVWTQHDMTIEGDVVTAFQYWATLKRLVANFEVAR
mgnify:CR=1 FL=1|jgi:hypothetical protein